MIRSIALAGLIVAAGVSLSSCNKAGDRDAPAALNLAASNYPEDKFGSGFGKDFRADPMSKPANVSDNDMIPVSNTAQPLPIE